MKIYIASDHVGFELKEEIKKHLADRMEVIDLGTNSAESVDYPDFAEKLVKNFEDRGILICGTGIGMSIAANKFPGVRAALCHGEFTAEMSRKHNDTNVLVLGAQVVDTETALKIVKIWLSAEFEGGRHQRRLDKLYKIEREILNYGN